MGRSPVVGWRIVSNDCLELQAIFGVDPIPTSLLDVKRHALAQRSPCCPLIFFPRRSEQLLLPSMLGNSGSRLLSVQRMYQNYPELLRSVLSDSGSLMRCTVPVNSAMRTSPLRIST